MPPLSTRVSDKSSVVTKSSIFFSFNCSWFSDVNGAIRFFAVVVAESPGKRMCGGCLSLKWDEMWPVCVSEGSDDGQPEQRDPLPSYLDYKSNSSVKSYQTSYFPSQCTEGPNSSSHSFQLSVGTGADVLGGSCGSDPGSRNPKLFCDGPLKPNTAYRYRSNGLLGGETRAKGGTGRLTGGHLACPRRLSVRAFTQLVQEDNSGLGSRSPLFTDTYLSLPVVTEAGERLRPRALSCDPRLFPRLG